MRLPLFLLTAAIAIAGEFTTSLGGVYPFAVSAVTTDAAGNTYIVGSRQLGSDPYTAAILGSDVFLTKLDPNGNVLFTDGFGGKQIDTGTAITLDPSGNIYIAGNTTSPDFPLSNALQTQMYQSGGSVGTGFIMKLSGDGATILYSTYFGGTLGYSSISALATDAKGDLYVTGTTNASDFPQTSGLAAAPLNISGTSGAMVAEISPTGDKLLYSGALAGTSAVSSCTNVSCASAVMNTTQGVGIGVDAAGNAYVGGNTNTTNLPTTAGGLSPNGIGGFVAKINAGGTGLNYLTYLSSGQSLVAPSPSTFVPAETLKGIAVDAAGNAFLAGSSSGAFPTTPGSLQPSFQSGVPGNTNGFLAKLNPTGSAMVWATYLGGTPGDSAQTIAIDASGDVWATGTTESSTFPNTNGWSTGPEFVARVNSSGSQMTYSALYPVGTVAQSVAVDPSGLVHVAGSNGFVSAIAPATAPTMKVFAFQNAFGGSATARIARAEVVSIYGPGIGPTAAAAIAPVNGFYPTTFAGVQVTVNGMSAPLLYVSANQINAVLPMELPYGVAATVHVTNGTSISPDYPVWLLFDAPQAFPTVLNQDGTINSSSSPAESGSIVTFYATGWQTDYLLADGQVANSAQNICLLSVSCPVVQTKTIYHASGTVLYAGTAPGIVAGVSQLNIQIGPIQPGSSPFQFNFYVAGPGTLTQTVWVAP
jgi:uncharacterized protein (TIGR03437 family)